MYVDYSTHPVEKLVFSCAKALDTELAFNITTDTNVTVLNEVYRVLESITTDLRIGLNSLNPCDQSERGR